MLSHPVQRMRITGDKDTSLAVFMVRDLAQKSGFRPIKTAVLCTAVSELTTNIVKYAEHGTVTAQLREQRHRKGIEVLVEDKGPGIADLEMAMKDHVSTSGTLGLGLPGTQRMVDDFELTSTPGQGTQIRIVVWD